MSKIETLFNKLSCGWCDVPSLCDDLKWKPHTLRAAISGLVLPSNGSIERRREDGVTSYRVKLSEPAEAAE